MCEGKTKRSLQARWNILFFFLKKKSKIRNECEVRRTERKKDIYRQRDHWQREGGNNGVNERELDRKGGVKQTRVQTHAVTDATARRRRERQLRGGGGGGERRHHSPATHSLPPEASGGNDHLPAPLQLLQDQCRTASNDNPLHSLRRTLPMRFPSFSI